MRKLSAALILLAFLASGHSAEKEFSHATSHTSEKNEWVLYSCHHDVDGGADMRSVFLLNAKTGEVKRHICRYDSETKEYADTWVPVVDAKKISGGSKK